MLDRLLMPLTFLTALGSGLVAGVFFAFSSFVMKALAKLPPAQGIAAMQSINVVVINPLFMSVLFGTAAGCLAIAIQSGLRWNEPGAAWRLASALIYLVGVIGVTIVCNVPRNDALATLDPTAPDSARLWAEYVSSWVAWNHVRTIGSLLAAAGFVWAMAAGRNLTR